MKQSIVPLVCAATIIALSLGLIAAHQHRIRLREDHLALERQVEEMARMVAAKTQLSNLLAHARSRPALTADESLELLRLRGQVGVLRPQIANLPRIRDENRQAHVALESIRRGENPPKSSATADYWPQDSWAFKGYATPDASLQTSLWASSNGDVKALLAAATGRMKEVIEADLGGKSATEASVKMMDEVMGMKSVRVINREPRGDDTTILTVEFEGHPDTHTEKIEMKKIGNDWKISGPVSE
jgi:hypothetical protein